jgi:hypothetical protein
MFDNPVGYRTNRIFSPKSALPWYFSRFPAEDAGINTGRKIHIKAHGFILD